jgi:hypothetical protein
MKSVGGKEMAARGEDPALRFIRLELAPSRERWIAALGFAGLAAIGVLATVTFRLPFPVLVFAGILLLTVPPPRRSVRQAVETTGAAALGAGVAILLAVTSYDQPWLYLPLQCVALTALLALSRVTTVRAGFILSALVVSFAEPAYLRDPEAAIRAALVNALALAGTAWAVAAAQSWHERTAIPGESPAPPGAREVVGFALLAATAIGLQMLFYNTINLPEIRTGVFAALLTADPDLREVWRRMPLRQLCAAGCAALALLMIAVGAPVMDDLGLFAAIAAGCYLAAGWVAHGSPRIAYASAPGAVAVTLALLPDFRFMTDIVPSLLNVAGVLWGMFVTATIALLLAPLLEPEAEQRP